MPPISQMIKERLTCHEFLTGVGVHVDRCGKVKCPFHGERTASLKVYEDPKRGWHCFGCGAGGSVIDLAILWYGEPYKETVKRINADFNLGLPMERPLSAEEMASMNAGIERKRAERKDKQMLAEAAHKAFLDAQFAWVENERILDAERPNGHFDEPSDRWLDAKVRQSELKYAMDCAEERWWQIRAEQKRGA